jgi:hypothetical protein
MAVRPRSRPGPEADRRRGEGVLLTVAADSPVACLGSATAGAYTLTRRPATTRRRPCAHAGRQSVAGCRTSHARKCSSSAVRRRCPPRCSLTRRSGLTGSVYQGAAAGDPFCLTVNAPRRLVARLRSFDPRPLGEWPTCKRSVRLTHPEPCRRFRATSDRAVRRVRVALPHAREPITHRDRPRRQRPTIEARRAVRPPPAA